MNFCINTKGISVLNFGNGRSWSFSALGRWLESSLWISTRACSSLTSLLRNHSHWYDRFAMWHSEMMFTWWRIAKPTHFLTYRFATFIFPICSLEFSLRSKLLLFIQYQSAESKFLKTLGEKMKNFSGSLCDTSKDCVDMVKSGQTVYTAVKLEKP